MTTETDITAEITPDNPPEECPGNLCTGMVLIANIYQRCPLDDNGCPFQDTRELHMHHTLLSGLGIGRRYQQANLEHVPDGYARDIVGEYVANIRQWVYGGQGLIIAGDVGTGKTSILALIAYAAARAAINVRYAYAGELFDNLHNDRGAAIDDYYNAELLLLDDLGVQYVTPWTASRFDALMEWRYANKLAVCVTTNIPPEELRKQDVFRRVVDRWSEMCRGISTGKESMRG